MQHGLKEAEREIQVMSQLLSQTPDDDPNTRLFLIRLANAHDKRFDLRHEPDDIRKVIECRTAALTLTPDDDSGLLGLLSALGTSHTKRFQCLGDRDDMEKAIEYKSIALVLIPEGDPDYPRQLINLATSHRDRFKHLGNLGDIEKAIEYDSRAVEMTATDNPRLPERLTNLGSSHIHRFQRLNELHDLEQAIGYQRRALALTPDGHPHLLIHLGKLALFSDYRFKRLGGLPNLEQVIDYGRRALALTHGGHPHLLIHLGNLAVYYKNRFKLLGELPDLEQAIDYGRRALAVIPDGHPDLSIHLCNLQASYSHRFERLGELPDLEQAIDCRRRALALTSGGHPNLSTHFDELALLYNNRFGRLGELSDLEQAIDYQRRALALTPDSHPGFSTHLGNLALSYIHRFGRLGELPDLEQAIDYQRRALALTPDGNPHLSRCLGNLAISYNCRFERLGELSDLEKAIDYQSRALALTPDGHPHLSIHLGNLAASYNHRFQRLGELRDLEQAIDYEGRVLDLTPDGHPQLSGSRGNLAFSYKERFKRLGELPDLKQAIEYEARALAAVSSDHPHSCLWHFNHAISYVTYYNYSHDPSHLHQALALFRHAPKISTASPRDRFQYAHQWASHASEHALLNPVEAYQATIDLLPQFIWLGAPADQRYQDLKSVQTLAVNAAHAAVLSSNHSLALEWLEHARCIAWNQNLMLRSPLDQLLDSHPALATRLQTVAAQLHTASSNSRESLAVSREMPLEKAGQDQRRLAKEYEDLLTEVRTQPGFEDFLQPMKAAGLMHAARNGPIVVINCHEERSDAIIVLPNQNPVAHLPLPSFSGKKAQHTHSIIQSFLTRKGVRERGFSLLHKSERQNNSDFGDVLMTLWTDVVKPVLDFLGLPAHSPGDELPHITWCPTGAASFLPLHAAGDYDQPAGSRVFDYVISSYTPTLTALLASTPSTLSRNSQVLAIGQANTPGHNQLPGTVTELKQIKAHVEDRAGYSELTGAQATPETVLDAMEQHEWVHLACHAHQNVYDPTQSGFFLHDGTLDLVAINRRSFKNKGLAFLSACQTATGDETLPNEAVHLASGMLMAGYSSVIATMWSVGDAEAPFVADKVYGQLMKTGTLGNGEAGRALHDAVEGLRGMVGDKEFARWVPFIHIGS